MLTLYDSQIFTLQRYGGISRYFVELVRRINNREGMNAKIIAPFYINQYVSELNDSIVSGWRVPTIPKVAAILNRLNKIASKSMIHGLFPGIVHETYYSETPPIVCRGAKTVVTVYDMIHELFPQYFPATDNTSHKKKIAVERADHIICISDTTRKDLLEITGVNPEKVSTVHLGFNLTVQPENSDAKILSEPYLLYVGDRGGYKNFDRVLKAYGKNPALWKNFKLVCFGGPILTQEEQALRKKLGLTKDKVVWFGGSDHILAQLYRDAAAFVYPSLYEGFGIPPLEAMFYNCPVICSGKGSISEVVGDGGEYFDPYDEESISYVIEQVVFSEQKVKELRKLGSKRIALFSWDACADKTYKIYQSL